VNGIFRGTVDGETDLRLLSGKISPEGSEGETQTPALPEKTDRPKAAPRRRPRKRSGGNRR